MTQINADCKGVITTEMLRCDKLTQGITKLRGQSKCFRGFYATVKIYTVPVKLFMVGVRSPPHTNSLPSSDDSYNENRLYLMSFAPCE